MKVLYDYQIFEIQRFGGVSRIFYELITALDGKDGRALSDLPAVHCDNDYLKLGPDHVSAKVLPLTQQNHYSKFLFGLDFKGKDKLYHLRNKLIPVPPPADYHEINKARSIEKLKAGDFDIFHPTYYDDYFLRHLGDKPYVVTVYDLVHQIFPEFFLDGTTPDKNFSLLNKASRIIAISESTKKDLINFYNIDASKIAVTHLANSLPKNPPDDLTSFKQQLPAGYLLFTGHRVDYKNFYLFAEAFSSLSIFFPSLKLVCTGPSFSDREVVFLKRLNIFDRVQHYYASDDELVLLYQNATIFVFPSLYEGFGIPLLEAFNNGCAVACSNTSSLVEIAEDGAAYFDPKDFISIRETIKTLLDHPDRRATLIEKGLLRAAKFSWGATVEQTMDVYRNVLAGNPR